MCLPREPVPVAPLQSQPLTTLSDSITTMVQTYSRVSSPYA